MIPRNLVIEWSESHSWPEQNQVEQDLLISRVLVEMFSDPVIAASLAFRGGTALYKLFLTPAPRYSEDIDLVQVNAGPIGETIDRIRAIIDPFLGTPKRKRGKGLSTIVYRYQSEEVPPKVLRLKIEINTREHFSIMGFIKKRFSIDSSWFRGETEILTYPLEELMGTKLRALYQRNKGRDLFDFWYTLCNSGLDIPSSLNVFRHYMDKEGLSVSRAQFEQNLRGKILSKVFLDDTPLLLREEIAAEWDPQIAHEVIQDRVISQLPGEPWKGG
ncbi:MAG: putative nucleotidyltransferase component of viral defense system [Chlamydiales bacterium]|jgi:predicted nucleotidyltransferase component of viral defense system